MKRSVTDALDTVESSSEGANDRLRWEWANKALCVFSWQPRRKQIGHFSGRPTRCGSEEGRPNLWDRKGGVTEGGLGASALSEKRARGASDVCLLDGSECASDVDIWERVHS